ncbi:ABC transporter permease [Verrucomicrobiota bacterium]
MIWRKALAFIKRDWTIESSYKFAFVFGLITSVLPVFSFYFIGKLVGGRGAESLSKYGVGYFPFAMIGVAFTQYLMVALRSFANTIRRSQMAGCLEAMLSTRTRPGTVIAMSSLYSFVMKTIHILLVFTIAGLFLGVEYRQANILTALVIVVLTILTFSSLGIFSAAVIVVLKKGDPIEWVFGSLCSLLGGALFPISIMPPWMQMISKVLPITYSLDAMRLAVFQGYTVPMVWKDLAILGGMAVILLPASIWSFSKAVDKGRRDGSLMHY